MSSFRNYVTYVESFSPVMIEYVAIRAFKMRIPIAGDRWISLLFHTSFRDNNLNLCHKPRSVHQYITYCFDRIISCINHNPKWRNRNSVEAISVIGEWIKLNKNQFSRIDFLLNAKYLFQKLNDYERLIKVLFRLHLSILGKWRIFKRYGARSQREVRFVRE